MRTQGEGGEGSITVDLTDIEKDEILGPPHLCSVLLLYLEICFDYD